MLLAGKRDKGIDGVLPLPSSRGRVRRYGPDECTVQTDLGRFHPLSPCLSREADPKPDRTLAPVSPLS